MGSIFVALLGGILSAQAGIAGFEDAKVLERVLAGEILFEKKVDTGTEYQGVVRMFVPGRETSDYLKVATEHAKYPNLLPEITEADTLEASADKQTYRFWTKMQVTVFIFTFTLTPEFRQRLTWAKDATSEARIVSQLTNYTDKIERGDQSTRLIPYHSDTHRGFLVEETTTFKLTEGTTLPTSVPRLLEQKLRQLPKAIRRTLTE